MKQKIILSMLILSLLLTFCGCNISPEKTKSENESLFVPKNYSLSNLTTTATDIFTATVISSVSLKKQTIFPNVDLSKLSATPIMYTVEVQQNIWSLTTTEKSTINVVIYVGDEKNGYWSKALEVGKTYLISGFVQPYNDKVVILDAGLLLSLIEGDSLIPVCSFSKRVLEGVDTFSDFINRSEIIELKDTEHDYIPSIFYTALDKSEIPAEPVYKISDNPEFTQKIIVFVSEALKVGSKIKICLGDDPRMKAYLID